MNTYLNHTLVFDFFLIRVQYHDDEDEGSQIVTPYEISAPFPFWFLP